MQSITLYKRLISYISPYWKMIVITTVATAGYAITDPLLMKLMQPLIDNGFAKKEMSQIYHSIELLFVIVVFRGITFFISNYSSRWVSSQIVFDLRQQMFAQLQQLPHRFFDKNNSGSILSKFNYDVLQLTNAATGAITVFVKEGMTVIALLTFLFYQNWKITLSTLIIAPLVGLVIKFVSKRLRKLAKTIQKDMGEMNHVIDENVKGQKIIKIYHGQKYETQKFHKATKNIRVASVKSELVSSLATPTIELMMYVVFSFVLLFSAIEAKNGHLSTGGFVAYLGMMAMIFSPIKKLTRINELLQRGIAASESIFTFLDQQTEAKAQQTATLTENVLGAIKFENVVFSYNQDIVLDNLTLNIQAGENVALVGASGSGKSSIANLIPRFYELNSGRILVDNVDISQIDLDALRQQISFINQDIVLFEGNVYENIAYGVDKKDIDYDKVKTSAQIAFASEFILDMEQGFDTQIGESGSRLSGGQKQRIAIARAVYKNAPIFILDEATSALDNESEQKVQQSLEELTKHKTSIIIAHRLSTVKNADRIIVLDKGKVVEEGNHKQLIDKQGYYYQLQTEKQLF